MRIPRDSIRFGGMELFAEFCRRHGLSISSADARQAFARDLGDVLQEMQSDQDRLRGLLGEAIFKSVVIELGVVELVKQEDAGEVHSRVPVQPPDLRLELPGGKSILVEVKDTNTDPGSGNLDIPVREFERYLQYSKLSRIDLYFAVLWRRSGIWTLVKASTFGKHKKKYRINFITAYLRNEMSLVGDKLVATKPPLRLVMDGVASQGAPISSFEPNAFVPTNIRLFCDGAEIIDQRGRRLAFFLMMYGQWRDTTPRATSDESDNVSICIEFTPNEDVVAKLAEEGQELYIVGALSSLHLEFSRLLSHDMQGSIRQTSIDASEGRLLRLASADFPFGESNLRLWLFTATPPE